MLKVISLVKRKPGISVENFQQYWRDQHAPLVARQAQVRRYVQSAALLQGYQKGDLLFDGISEIWFDSDATFRAYADQAGPGSVAEDEDKFMDRARTVAMPVDVHVMKEGAVPDNAVKNIEFVNRRATVALERFRAHWRTIHGPLAARIPLMRRYEQNHLLLSAYGDRQAPRYDGLAITWFASTSDMKKGTSTPEYIETRADEANFLPDGHLPIIITREHIVVPGMA
jgi:uncharacterized protein (TIGR02118 family)